MRQRGGKILRAALGLSSPRQKLTIVSLLIYWPTIFISTHTPIPEVVYEAEVSDKSLHFVAYLVLFFLLWFAINPDKKVNWLKSSVWWILLAVIFYAVADELLQGYVGGRTCALTDFMANIAGAAAAAIVFRFFTFWPASLLTTGITIFILANLTYEHLADLLPVATGIFYLLGCGFFTMLWICYMQVCWAIKAPRPKWLIVALALPAFFLLTVRLFSVAFGKNFSGWNAIWSAAGIAAVVFAVFLTALFRRSRAQKSSEGDLERAV